MSIPAGQSINYRGKSGAKPALKVMHHIEPKAQIHRKSLPANMAPHSFDATTNATHD
ncbi:hypothetical protein [Rhodanobacter sp. A1T4]|jgi:hypothetical protein|uniref:hypothetical protein n=1 Tax=Rhodanobacter sp. A1T4 TaxID=2723087 RepID=UPI0016201245|nr:hypothetical protein [Rhodanobacter sp. A1T4]MBB6248716.1 hypothetical protein [Rhodanobacter sp. A1T4]